MVTAQLLAYMQLVKLLVLGRMGLIALLPTLY
jgi:hypothetical protein